MKRIGFGSTKQERRKNSSAIREFLDSYHTHTESGDYSKRLWHVGTINSINCIVETDLRILNDENKIVLLHQIRTTTPKSTKNEEKLTDFIDSILKERTKENPNQAGVCEKQGFASAVFKVIINLADQHNITLLLNVRPSGSMSRIMLIDWYKKNGFQHTQTNKWIPSNRVGDYWMIRKSIRKNKMAAGYQSYGWTTQDWRSVFLHKDRVSFDKKCGADGTRLPSGKPRLCLPLSVIEKLLKSESGTQILRSQALKKQRADKGKKVPWHPRIKELHRQLQQRTVKDQPKRKNGYKAVVVGKIGITIDGKDYHLQPNPKREDELAELKAVIKQSQEPTLSAQRLHDLDKHLVTQFDLLLDTYGIKGERPFLSKLTQFAIPIIMFHKHHYNRLRPHQLAQKLGVDFQVLDYPESALSPSYPSGHSAQAYLLAYQAGRKYPHLKKPLIELAEEVGKSRIELGVHFPSDIAAGKLLAQHLDKKLQSRQKTRIT